jgi:hypothetical protein
MLFLLGAFGLTTAVVGILIYVCLFDIGHPKSLF